MADNLSVASVRVMVAQPGHHLRPNKAECPMKLTCVGLCLAEQSNHAQPGTMAMGSKKVTSRHCCVTLGQVLVVFFRTRTLTCRRPLPLCPAVWSSISASGHGFPHTACTARYSTSRVTYRVVFHCKLLPIVSIGCWKRMSYCSAQDDI